MPRKLSLGIIGVALVAVVLLSYAGYSDIISHSRESIPQPYIANSPLGTTTSPISTPGNYVTSQNTATNAVSGYAYQASCPTDFGCYWPYNYDLCHGTGDGTNVICQGYLTQGRGGCVELAVPTLTVQQPPYNHYSLQNLPVSSPPIGSWVLVDGHLFEGLNQGLSGACPSSYIYIDSIQPTTPTYP